MSVFINPYTDFGFKKLFGEEANKALLIDFLNALLPQHHQIADLTFQNVEALPDTSEERKAFFDIHCQALSGERFIVEMQKAKVKYFKDRSLYYLTYPIREQAKKGDWDFMLTPIYFIAVLDFFYDTDIKNAKFWRTISLTDQDGEIFYNKLQLTYLQMPAFNKSEKQLYSKMDKWAFFLKNLESLEDIPLILNEPIFNKAFETAKLANFNPKQVEEYEKSRLGYIGAKQIALTALEEGEAIGFLKGLAQAQEIAQKEKEQMILMLHKNQIPLAAIAMSVNMNEQEVKNIIDNQ